MNGSRRSEDNARWTTNYPRETFLKSLTLEYQTTAQVRDKIGCSRELATLRLTELFNDGKVARIKAGNIWLWKLPGTTTTLKPVDCPEGCANVDQECENCVAGSHFKAIDEGGRRAI